MQENKDSQVTSLSKAHSIGEIADYWDQTHEIEFELRAKRRRRITLTPDVYEKIEAQARVQGVLPETLVNVWLAEQLQEVK